MYLHNTFEYTHLFAFKSGPIAIELEGVAPFIHHYRQKKTNQIQ